jgi:hypothetical protein
MHTFLSSPALRSQCVHLHLRSHHHHHLHQAHQLDLIDPGQQQLLPIITDSSNRTAIVDRSLLSHGMTNNADVRLYVAGSQVLFVGRYSN